MTLKWGIVGCGDVAQRRVAAAITENESSELVAACRRDQAKLGDFCDRFSVLRAYREASLLLADQDIDAVYIATPVNLHCEQTIAAAEAKKHVLVEKPMAMSVRECDEMINACRDNGVTLGVAYYRRFYSIVARISDLVQSGGIGRFLSAHASVSSAFDGNPRKEGFWRVVPSQGGGGPLMDIGSHRLDLFFGLFGPMVDVKAHCDTLVSRFETEDAATVIVNFERGGHGLLQCFFACSANLDQLTIVGTTGILHVPSLNGSELITRRDGQETREQHPPSANFNSPLIADFVHAVDQQREPLVTGESGKHVNWVMEQAYKNSMA